MLLCMLLWLLLLRLLLRCGNWMSLWFWLWSNRTGSRLPLGWYMGVVNGGGWAVNVGLRSPLWLCNGVGDRLVCSGGGGLFSGHGGSCGVAAALRSVRWRRRRASMRCVVCLGWLLSSTLRGGHVGKMLDGWLGLLLRWQQAVRHVLPVSSRYLLASTLRPHARRRNQGPNVATAISPLVPWPLAQDTRPLGAITCTSSRPHALLLRRLLPCTSSLLLLPTSFCSRNTLRTPRAALACNPIALTRLLRRSAALGDRGFDALCATPIRPGC